MIDSSKTFTEHVGYIHSLSLVPHTFFNQEVAQQAQSNMDFAYNCLLQLCEITLLGS